jgi:Skp family chaperone for outer membrane proteins
MKKYLATLFLLIFLAFQGNSQSRGIRIGYIDMEYILQNVPDYTEAKNQLEQKAQKWKQEIEAKKVDLAKLKDALKTERVLLTKELIDEREEEIVPTKKIWTKWRFNCSESCFGKTNSRSSFHCCSRHFGK